MSTCSSFGGTSSLHRWATFCPHLPKRKGQHLSHVAVRIFAIRFSVSLSANRWPQFVCFLIAWRINRRWRSLDDSVEGCRLWLEGWIVDLFFWLFLISILLVSFWSLCLWLEVAIQQRASSLYQLPTRDAKITNNDRTKKTLDLLDELSCNQCKTQDKSRTQQRRHNNLIACCSQKRHPVTSVLQLQVRRLCFLHSLHAMWWEDKNSDRTKRASKYTYDHSQWQVE
jgi:hypothetical protein